MWKVFQTNIEHSSVHFVLEKAVILKYRVVYYIVYTPPIPSWRHATWGCCDTYNRSLAFLQTLLHNNSEHTCARVYVILHQFTYRCPAPMILKSYDVFFGEWNKCWFYNKIKVILRKMAKTNLWVSFEGFLSRHRKPEETRRGIIQLWVGLEWLTRMLHRVTARVVASFWGPGLDLLPLKVTRPLQGMF